MCLINDTPEPDRQPLPGDLVVAASPGAAEGRVKLVLARGRLIVATEHGCIRVPFSRLVWSTKRKAWRCFSPAAIAGADALSKSVPDTPQPRAGDCIRILNWPLTNVGFVLSVHHKMIKGGRLNFAIVSTSCGRMTIMLNSPRLSYDPLERCWLVDYSGWEKVWLTAPPPILAPIA